MSDLSEKEADKGDTGYMKGGRIHDAKYLEKCKLVFVHDKAVAFRAHGK